MRLALLCQNGCNNSCAMLVQEISTGEVRNFCFSCLRNMSKNSTDLTVELRDEFVFWPVREDEELNDGT